MNAFADSVAGSLVGDSVITTKIKTEMMADKSISSLNINIETNNGIVALAGTVPTDSFYCYSQLRLFVGVVIGCDCCISTCTLQSVSVLSCGRAVLNSLSLTNKGCECTGL